MKSQNTWNDSTLKAQNFYQYSSIWIGGEKMRVEKLFATPILVLTFASFLFPFPPSSCFYPKFHGDRGIKWWILYLEEPCPNGLLGNINCKCSPEKKPTLGMLQWKFRIYVTLMCSSLKEKKEKKRKRTKKFEFYDSGDTCNFSHGFCSLKGKILGCCKCRLKLTYPDTV